MNSKSSSFFNEILQNVDIDNIPIEFILMAKVTDMYGQERLLENDEMLKVMRGPERKKLMGARVILDVKKIKLVVTTAINTLYAEVNRRAEIREAAAALKDNDI